nr:MAG TPA: S-adenosylmethionine synthetase domain protein [Caudoviricetes sp.]
MFFFWSIVLYEGHPDILCIQYKLPETTIMFLRGLWSL